MFVEVVTLVTLAILWGRFEAVFLTTEAPGIGGRGRKSEVRGQRTKDVLPGGGVLKRTGGAKRAKPMFAGFFAFWKRTRGRGVVRFEKRVWANVYGLGTAVRFEKQGLRLRREFSRIFNTRGRHGFLRVR